MQTEIEIIKSDRHHFYENKGNVGCYHFSVADYYNPNAMGIGSLRVFNEYIIQPDLSDLGDRFQSIKDMEIVTLLIDGELEYRDNIGNHERISAGDMYRISAGTGIVYSVKINSKSRRVKIIEAWFYPSKYSLKPSWAKRNFPVETYTDKLLWTILSEKSSNNLSAIKIHQDANLYISKLSSQKEIKYKVDQERRVYLVIVNGKICLNDNSNMDTRDAAKVTSPSENISLRNNDVDSTDLIIVDLPNI